MDKSELYIKMCDCPEIQEQWRKFACIEERLVWADKTSKDSHANLWLPRQDQIQEMMGKSESCFCIFQTKGGWGGEIIQDREHVFYVVTNSPEQVWLAFYVHEKHSKIWSSKEEKWVKK